MQLGQLKEALKRDAIHLALVVVLLGGGLLYILSLRSDLQDSAAQLKRDISLANNKITRLQKENTEFLSKFTEFNTLPENKIQGGFSQLPQRVEVFQQILDALRDTYRISRLRTNITNVSQLGVPYIQGNMTAYSNVVVLEFSSFSDELALAFLYALEQALPGYIRIESFTMQRVQPISQSVLEQLDEGRALELVRCRANIVWKTIEKS